MNTNHLEADIVVGSPGNEERYPSCCAGHDVGPGRNVVCVWTCSDVVLQWRCWWMELAALILQLGQTNFCSEDQLSQDKCCTGPLASLQAPSQWSFSQEPVHSKKKKLSKHLFLVLQLVTNRGLYSVAGRTKWNSDGQKICLSWCFQIPFSPSRY